jgi:drug/metabolite transporter (DMT)-like permease
VAQPTGGSTALGGLLMVISAFGVAARDISTRFVPRTIPSLIVALATCIGAMLGGVLMLPFSTLAPFEGPVLAYVVSAAVLIVLGNFMSVLAFREVAIATVSPFRYTSAIWGILASGLVFGQWPSALVYGGMALIIGSSLYILHRERVKGVERPAQEAASPT